MAALDSGSSMYRRYGGILVDFRRATGYVIVFLHLPLKLSAISWEREHRTLNWRPLKERLSAASRGRTRLSVSPWQRLLRDMDNQTCETRPFANERGTKKLSSRLS